MDQILPSLILIKSIWELMYIMPIIFERVYWDMILSNLIPLFRKDTFSRIVNSKTYYPQETPNCRYYIKPNGGSCGKGIQIVNELPLFEIKDCTICPEIISPLIEIDNKKYKCDYRVWIAIQSDLTYFVCPTLIRRISSVPFSLISEYGSLTNTSLYSNQDDYQDILLYNKINLIVADILKSLHSDTSNVLDEIDPKKHLMLTGWDFIENEYGDVFVLEVNCNPGICIQHVQIMTEFLEYINSL